MGEARPEQARRRRCVRRSSKGWASANRVTTGGEPVLGEQMLGTVPQPRWRWLGRSQASSLVFAF